MIQFLRTEWLFDLMVYEHLAALALLAGGAYLTLLSSQVARRLLQARKKRQQS